MPDLERGTDRAGRRAKRFLPPLQNYEIWLQLVWFVSEFVSGIGSTISQHLSGSMALMRGARSARSEPSP